MSKIHKLVDWMTGLNLRICSPDITREQIDDDEYLDCLKKFHADKETLILELRTNHKTTEPWIIGMELETGTIVLVPWWYFREAEL